MCCCCYLLEGASDVGYGVCLCGEFVAVLWAVIWLIIFVVCCLDVCVTCDYC